MEYQVYLAKERKIEWINEEKGNNFIKLMTERSARKQYFKKFIQENINAKVKIIELFHE